MAERKISRRDFVKESALAAGGLALGASALRAAEADTRKIPSYNPNMEYRRLGRTGLMVSAVSLGGHWKRIEKMVADAGRADSWIRANLNDPGFQKNRAEVVRQCLEVGINYIDACCGAEVTAYTRALKGLRDKVYLGVSWCEREVRNEGFRTAKALLQVLDEGFKANGLEYADLWRITMHEQSGRHTEGEVEEMMKSLETAKKAGKVRFTGLSSHDRPHIQSMIEKYPALVDAVCTPYTAKTKAAPEGSMFETMKKYDVGFFGIKPFASNSIFKGDSSLVSPDLEEDDKRARLAIRYILCNPIITSPIPGLVNTHQVDNVAKAVQERRQLDRTEKAELDKAMDEAWAKLPDDYQWLKDWEYV
ncbi:MAG: aldo/keto reductase [Planctomycetota bacterium]|nr:aldo/keto reductase [Planctomycetota bacterium]